MAGLAAGAAEVEGAEAEGMPPAFRAARSRAPLPAALESADGAAAVKLAGAAFPGEFAAAVANMAASNG